MRERVLVAGLCVVAALAGGCATDPPPRAPGLQGTTTSLPLPENARMLESSVATPPAPDCGDPTASLPPDPNATGPAIDRIRTRGRLIVGLDTGSNLMSYRDTADRKSVV